MNSEKSVSNVEATTDMNVLNLMLETIQFNKNQANATETIIRELISTKTSVADMKDEVMTAKDEIQSLALEIKDNIHLWPVEVIGVRTEVEIKSRHITSRRVDVSYKKAAQNVWRSVYRTFGVSSVYFIRRHDYDSVIQYIRNFQYNK